jgi:hypothetical protein
MVDLHVFRVETKHLKNSLHIPIKIHDLHILPTYHYHTLLYTHTFIHTYHTHTLTFSHPPIHTQHRQQSSICSHDASLTTVCLLSVLRSPLIVVVAIQFLEFTIPLAFTSLSAADTFLLTQQNCFGHRLICPYHKECLNPSPLLIF